MDDILQLDVGGSHFTTSRTTLCRHHGSMLSTMFQEEPSIPVAKVAGRCFIDRDGTHFRHVLNYCRDDTLPVGLPRRDRLELMREADFYGLSGLHQWCVGGNTVEADIEFPPPEQLMAEFRAHWGERGRDFKEALRKMLSDIQTRIESSRDATLWNPDFALYPDAHLYQAPTRNRAAIPVTVGIYCWLSRWSLAHLGCSIR